MAVSDRIAVMNQGSVVQDGGAQDLYHRPASDFVAKFIGRVNSVPATVAASGAAPAVTALGTTFAVRALPASLGPGAAVQLMVRPEAVEVVAAGAAAALPATVVGSTFLGEKIELELECNGVGLQAIRDNTGLDAPLAEGAAVGVRLPAHALTVLPPADRGAA